MNNSPIPIKSVVLGGLVAGLIINVGEVVLNGILLLDHYVERSMTWGIPEPPWANALFGVYGFLLGILLVGSYAVAQTRFGARSTSILLAGAGIWFVYHGSFAVFHLAIPLFSPAVALGNLAWGLPEILLSAAAGAWVYEKVGGSDA